MEESGRIILYTSSECSRCKTVKQMLDCHNVQYDEIADNKQLMLDKGIETVPALEVDNKIIDAYVGVLAWLNENNYYSLWGDNANESSEA